MSHSEIAPEKLMASLKGLPAKGCVFFKFEPFVLHMCCRTLEGARTSMGWAVDAGFRNSGLSIGKNEKIVLAVRSTHSLEVPIALDGALIVSEEYLRQLVELGNQKMAENFLRINRFEQNVLSGFEGASWQGHMHAKEQSHDQLEHTSRKHDILDNNSDSEAT